jgi:hypothetical protein
MQIADALRPMVERFRVGAVSSLNVSVDRRGVGRSER